MTVPPPHRDLQPFAATGSAVRLALTLGLLLGLVEYPLLLLRRAILHRWIGVGPDALWLAPLAYAIAFVLIAVPLHALLGRTRAREWAMPVTAGLLLFTATSAALFIFHPALHKIAILLMSAGVVRMASAPLLRAWPRLEWRATFVAAGLVATAGVAVTVRHRVERASGEAAVAAREAPAPNAPNVLLLILDTVRAANLSLYGYHRPTTPTLQRLATRGVTFDRAYSSAPWTLPSHASVFTGRHPHEFRADWWQPLHKRFPTIGEAFQQAGYATGGFVANTVNCAVESGLARGFDRYADYAIGPGEAVQSTSLGRALSTNRLLRRLIGTEELPGRKRAGMVNAEALTWIRGREGRPWFAFLNYFDAHQPYAPTGAFAGRFGPSAPYRGFGERLWNGSHLLAPGVPFAGDTARMIAAYDASIAELDSMIGVLLDSLPRDRRTIIIVTADHGEEFGEHGWFEHGLTLYPLALHVPLLVVDEKNAPAGRRVQQVAALRDLAATITDLADLKTSITLGGRSLSRYWNGGVGEELALAEVSWVPWAPPGAPVGYGDSRALVTDKEEFIWRGDSTGELLRLDAAPEGVVVSSGLDPQSPEAEWYDRALHRLVPDSQWRQHKATGFTSAPAARSVGALLGLRAP